MSILRTDLTPRRSIAPRVHFAMPTDIKAIVVNYLNGQEKEVYNELIINLKNHNNSSESLSTLLDNCFGLINLLDQRMHALVVALLNTKWNDGTPKLASRFQQFLLELVASHNYYTKPVLENLLKRFYGSGEAWSGLAPSEAEEITYERVHSAIKQVLMIIPMSVDMLLQAASTCFPFMKRGPKMNQSYVYNLLKITEYQPSIRQQMLSLVINKIIAIDVQIPREVLENMDEEGDEMETDEKCNDTATVFTMDDVSRSASKYSSNSCNEFELAHTLDILMEQIFCYIRNFVAKDTEPQSWSHHRILFKDLLSVFEKQMLFVHGSHHVQFFMFYLCSLRAPTIAELFLSSLWSKVTCPSETSVARQTSAFYISSLLARGVYISAKTMRCMLAQMAEWCHSYVAAQQEASCDVKAHSVFYAVCQGLFYVVAFRHADLVGTPKGLLWTQSLGLAKLVTSRLNPLKPCLPAIAQNFASVTRTYQIAYCYTVIERNARSFIPTVDQSGHTLITNLSCFFPFDPYLLTRSAPFVVPSYREYEALEQPGEAPSDSEGEEEDAENVSPQRSRRISQKSNLSSGSLTHVISSPKSFTDMFCYGSSPGFKHF